MMSEGPYEPAGRTRRTRLRSLCCEEAFWLTVAGVLATLRRCLQGALEKTEGFYE
jgi:hypothetical protein